MAIDKETYDERWERIFGKDKKFKGTKVFVAPDEYCPVDQKTEIKNKPIWIYQEHCNCKRCFDERRKREKESNHNSRIRGR